MIDRASELRSTHTPSAKVFFHTEGTLLVAMKLGSFASAVPFLHPPPPPPLWGSRVEKLKWQRGGRRWGWPGAPCRQPARPRSHRPAASPSVLPRGNPSPTGRQCPAAVPGPGRAVRVLPQERAQKWKSLVRNPPQPPLFIHSVGVSVQRGVAPSPGSFSRLGTGLCIHPGAPNLCVPGKRTAPPCSAAPRPAPPPRAPRRAAPTRPAPSFRPSSAARPAAAGPPPASPRRAAAALPRPANPEPGAGAGPRGCGAAPPQDAAGRGGEGRGDAGGVRQHQQPRNANFLAPPTPPVGQLPASGLSGTAR